MNFPDSVKTCLQQYATFTGRASRSEFWWFTLFCCLASIGASFFGETANLLVTLALLVPAIAVTARRLHDIDKSGWWQLVGLVPLVGWLVVLYWYVQPTQQQANRFGVEPVRIAAQ